MCIRDRGEVDQIITWLTGYTRTELELSLIHIFPMKTEADRGKKKVWVPVSLMVPEMVTRSSGVAANFLCDNSKYILGIDAEGTSPRVLECFQASRERHLKLLNGIGGRMAHAICLFFETWDPEEAEQDPVIKEKWQEVTDGGNLIFVMGMDYAQEDPWIREAWEKSLERMGTGTQGVCLVTGEDVYKRQVPGFS